MGNIMKKLSEYARHAIKLGTELGYWRTEPQPLVINGVCSHFIKPVTGFVFANNVFNNAGAGGHINIVNNLAFSETPR
jgi:hypothetical protein